jgi:D-threo-aldose 1-dehydrogenase
VICETEMSRFALFSGATPSTGVGFGTTSLMGLTSTGERLKLLGNAFDAGIRHYDTAPYYGYGEAERALGDFLNGKRDECTITTKYGILPPAVVKARWVNLMARKVLHWFPMFRTAFSRKAQALSKKPPFTAAAARKSLEQSLVALKTDRIDLFLLHEPTFADAAAGEILQFLNDEKRMGRIRAYGCGGKFEVLQKVAAAGISTSEWLQFEDNVLSRRIEEIRATGARCITYRTFHQALPILARWLEVNQVQRAEWERRLQVNLKAEGNLAGLLQAASHARNPDGIVLFSTRRADRIHSAVEVASGRRFSSAQAKLFDELVRDGHIQPGADS